MMNSRLKCYAMAVAMVGVVLGVAGCGSSGSTSSDGSAAALAKLSVTSLPGSLLGLPEYVAAEKGFFKDHGLDVTLVPTASGPAAMQVLLTGSADITLNSPDIVLGANDKGQSLKIVAGATVANIQTFLTRKGWPVPHAGSYPAAFADLKGAKVGVTARGSLQEIQLRAMLKEAGLDADKDVTIVATGLPTTALPALQNGQIDVLMSIEPATTVALNQMKIANVVVDLRKGEGQGPEEIVNYSTNVFAAKTDFIKNHGDLIQRFVDAIAEAQAWIQNPANKTDVEAVVAKNVKIDASLVPQMVMDNLVTYGIAVPRDHIENAITMAKAGGMIKGSPTYEDVVDTKYVKTN